MEHQYEKLVGILEDVEHRHQVRFDPLEWGKILHHTIRKVKANGKGEDYIPVLFENELEDHLMRQEINRNGGGSGCVALLA